MKLRTLLLSAVALVLAVQSNAQDKIYKRNGSVINASVEEVTSRVVKYKKENNPDGPTYTIDKDDVAKIEYPNDAVDIFRELDEVKREKNRNKYGRNLIAIAPIQVTEGIGLGVSYERILDENGIVSFHLPVTIAFTNQEYPDAYSSTYTGRGYYGSVTNNFPTYMVMPGIRIYPTSAFGVVRYSLGPNFIIGTGKRYLDEYVYDNIGNITDTVVGYKDRFLLGVAVTNSLNINPTKHLYLGMDMGLGFTYMNRIDGRTRNTAPLINFAFKIGYRF